MSQSLQNQAVSVFDSVHFGIIIGDLEGRIVYRNRAALDIYNSSEIPPEPRKRALLHILKVGEHEFPIEPKDLPLPRIVQEGRIEDQEFVIFTGDGSRRKLLYSGQSLHIGSEKIGAILFLIDPTTQPKNTSGESENLDRLAKNASSHFQSILKPAAPVNPSLKGSLVLRFFKLFREFMEPASRATKTLFLKDP